MNLLIRNNMLLILKNKQV